MTGHLFVVAAPSGAGKTSLVDALLRRDPNLCVSVSHTTRPRRAAEEDGVHYYFVTDDEFEAMVAAGEFLEHACVFGNSYGTSRARVAEMLATGRDVVLEIDWQGAQQVRAHWLNDRGDAADFTSIFILPPSRKTLIERLRGRAQDDEETIARRTAEAAVEIAHCDDFDFPVVNDDFDTALDELVEIVEAARAGKTVAPRNVSSLVAQLLEA